MIGLAMGVGAGLSAIGSVMGFGASEDQEEAQKNIIRFELKNEALRNKAMNLTADRQDLEIFRNQQRAMAMGLVNATSQGAGGGSGLQGGYGQISGQTGVNFLGVEQNREIGQDTFLNNKHIGYWKMKSAEAQGDMAFAQGLTSLGGSIMGTAGTMSKLGGFGGGNYTGGAAAGFNGVNYMQPIGGGFYG